MNSRHSLLVLVSVAIIFFSVGCCGFLSSTQKSPTPATTPEQTYVCPGGSVVSDSSQCPKAKLEKKDTAESKEFASVSLDIDKNRNSTSYVKSKMPILQQNIDKLKTLGYDTQAEQYVYDLNDALVNWGPIYDIVASESQSANQSAANSDYAAAKISLNNVIQTADAELIRLQKLDAYSYSVTAEAKNIYLYNRKDTSEMKPIMERLKTDAQEYIDLLAKPPLISCKNNDGVCPPGCDYDSDSDCAQPTCTDGTQMGYCSDNKPYYCTGNYSKLTLESKPSVCGCPDGTLFQSDGYGGMYNGWSGSGSCVSVTCTDGTPYGSCSKNGLYYCTGDARKPELILDLSSCSCPSGQTAVHFGGTIVCRSKDCLDGTKVGECSQNKPKYCSGKYSTPTLEDDSLWCGCPSGQTRTYSNSVWSCVTSGGSGGSSNTCSDGTPLGQCSTTKPKYCTGYSNPTLEDLPFTCGCPSGQTSTYSNGAWTCVALDEVGLALSDCNAAADKCSWLTQSQYQSLCTVAAEIRPSASAVEKLHQITAQISANKLCQ